MRLVEVKLVYLLRDFLWPGVSFFVFQQLVGLTGSEELQGDRSFLKG